MARVGIGYDAHRLVRGRPLILGGVEIEYDRGLEGHSDADVLIHALMDALLGAAGLGDIGHHFPSDDNRYLNISSLLLLAQVQEMLQEEGWQLGNADCVVIAEQPRLAAQIEKMQDNLSAVLAVPKGRITIKATTTEGMGFCGRKEGIAAQAVVLLEKAAHPDPTGHEAS